MQPLFSKQHLKYVLPLLVVLGVILYTTGYAGRFYSRLQNALIRTGVITPGRAEASDFERIEVDPESLYMMTLTDLQGEELTLGDFKEDVVLINFWASWCPPCIAEMPGLNQLYEKKKQEIGFLMITWDKDIERARQYRDGKGYTFPVYKTIGAVPAALRASSIPTTIILVKKEKAVYRHVGMIAFDDPSMGDFLTELRQ